MNKGGCLPKFFKVYLPYESGDDLTLPICFNRFIPNSLPENVTVRSIYGNVWKLELRKCFGDNIEKFVMVNGWKRIVKDEYLTGGEFLVFEFDGSRLFNFCIYGHATCKRLISLVQTKDFEDKSDDENDKLSDDVIVLSDDVTDDQEYGDKDKSADDIIVLSDDDDDDGDDQINVEEDKSSEDIIVLDDDDSDDDDQDYGDDDYKDDDNKRKKRDETERKEKGSCGFSTKTDGEGDKQYPDNNMNPFFAVNQNLILPAKVFKDI